MAAAPPPPSNVHTASLMTFYLPDSEPLSLEASLKTVRPNPTETRASTAYFEISCPTASSPENDACRSAGIYPAEVHHQPGSIWGGTTTYSADDSTTTWQCALGGGLGSPDGLDAECTKSIVDGDGRSTTQTTTFPNCYNVAHLVPMVVTAGAETLPEAYYVDFYGEVTSPEELNGVYEENLRESECPVSETTMWAGSVSGSGSDSDSESGSGSGTITSSPEATGLTSQSRSGSGTGSETQSPASTASGGSENAGVSRMVGYSWKGAFVAFVCVLGLSFGGLSVM